MGMDHGRKKKANHARERGRFRAACSLGLLLICARARASFAHLPFRCDLNICFNTWCVPVMRENRGALSVEWFKGRVYNIKIRILYATYGTGVII